CKKNLINEKLNQIYNEETDNPHTSMEITKKISNSPNQALYQINTTENTDGISCVFYSPERRLRPVREAAEIYFPDCFQYEGHTHDFEIDVSLYALVLKNNIKKMRTCQITQCAQNVLALSKVPAEASISNAFTADVETSLKINITMKGFLTIRANFKGPMESQMVCSGGIQNKLLEPP
ncbi:hypothetical protein JTB14_025973, partial [Gonioctena quinquepunctata]